MYNQLRFKLSHGREKCEKTHDLLAYGETLNDQLDFIAESKIIINISCGAESESSNDGNGLF